MGYPKSLYKGGYTPEAIHAEHEIVRTEAEEKALRAKGFVDGKEFFSEPVTEKIAEPVIEKVAKPATEKVAEKNAKATK